MITEKEIVNEKIVPEELKENLKILLERINKLRHLWGKPMKITSGWRSMEEHLKIYAKKGVTDKSKIPMKSSHLYCKAVDILDKNGSLKRFVKENNYKILIECDLYMEEESATNGWLHVQINSPISKKREFIP